MALEREIKEARRVAGDMPSHGCTAGDDRIRRPVSLLGVLL